MDSTYGRDVLLSLCLVLYTAQFPGNVKTLRLTSVVEIVERFRDQLFTKMYVIKLHRHVSIQSQLFRSRTRFRNTSKALKVIQALIHVVLNSLGFKRSADLRFN